VSRLRDPARDLRPKRLLVVLGCLLGIAVNCYLKLPALPRIVHGDNDFMGFYAGAQLVASGDLYNPEALTRAESRLWDTPRFLPFVRLPVYAAAISPLRFFSYHHAYWIWQSVSLAAVLLFVWFWPAPRKWITAMTCCWSVPLLDCFIMGRDLAVVMLALAVSLALLFGGRRFAAGCVFSLCLIKYNLFLSIPLLIFGKRLWRFGGGVVSGGAALLAMSFAVGGRSWPWRYAAMLRLPATTPSYDGMPNLHGLLSGLPHSVFLEPVVTCVVIVAAWLVIRGADIATSISATLVTGLLVSYHAFFGDALILAPACLLLLSRAPSARLRLVAIFLLCPLAYLPFLLPAPPFPPSAVVLLPLLALAAEQVRASVSPWRPAASAHA
jgi:hypothetical protein